MNMHNNVAR